jgi:hypothetical protein
MNNLSSGTPQVRDETSRWMEIKIYTLVLTKSSHTINHETASEIKRALAAGDPMVDVDLRLFDDGVRRTTLNTAHIIAISEEDSDALAAAAGSGKVQFLRRATQAR